MEKGVFSKTIASEILLRRNAGIAPAWNLTSHSAPVELSPVSATVL
jgi:hypothetical protein